MPSILSVVTTCRNNGIDVRRYLMDVLRRAYTHPNSRLEELLPDPVGRPSGGPGREYPGVEPQRVA